MKNFKDLHNKKVKINVDNYKRDWKSRSNKFKKYIQDNKDKVFTAVYPEGITEETFSGVYELKEDRLFWFGIYDLIEVKEKK